MTSLLSKRVKIWRPVWIHLQSASGFDAQRVSLFSYGKCYCTAKQWNSLPYHISLCSFAAQCLPLWMPFSEEKRNSQHASDVMGNKMFARSLISAENRTRKTFIRCFFVVLDQERTLLYRVFWMEEPRSNRPTHLIASHDAVLAKDNGTYGKFLEWFAGKAWITRHLSGVEWLGGPSILASRAKLYAGVSLPQLLINR